MVCLQVSAADKGVYIAAAWRGVRINVSKKWMQETNDSNGFSHVKYSALRCNRVTVPGPTGGNGLSTRSLCSALLESLLFEGVQ